MKQHQGAIFFLFQIGGERLWLKANAFCPRSRFLRKAMANDFIMAAKIVWEIYRPDENVTTTAETPCYLARVCSLCGGPCFKVSCELCGSQLCHACSVGLACCESSFCYQCADVLSPASAQFCERYAAWLSPSL